MQPSEAEKWLRAELPLHERLAPLATTLLKNMMNQNNIEYLSISYRLKTKQGALEKIDRKEYSNPPEQLTDLTGIRVVTYLERQVEKISDIIKELFVIDESNSLDKTSTLGRDRVGYRSSHFVCTIGRKRGQLPEYKNLGDLPFEIQVRTVLQHAWAELAHDNSFKLDAVLPEKIERKLNLHAAMLEIADNAFQEIFDEIENYKKEIENSDTTDFSESPIDSITLSEFVRKQLDSISLSFRENIDRKVISELSQFGISYISQLEAMSTKDFLNNFKKVKRKATSIGFLRSLLMYSDVDKYFERRKSWNVMSESTKKFLESRYGAEKISQIMSDNAIYVKGRNII